MDNENIIISGSPIEIAEFDTYKLATFLISVLDEFDLNGRMIPKESGEAYHATIRGFPIVSKLVYDYAGNPIDFKGHEMTIIRNKDGNFQAKFGTTPIGSVMNSWIEDREVKGYNGLKSCIMIQAKLWSDRYPEYFKVLDKLWAENKVKSSWEIKSSEVEQLPLGKKILKVFSFVGNALLGSTVEGAVPGAGVYEYAELNVSDDDYALAEALSNDFNIEHKSRDKNEGESLENKTDEIMEVENKVTPVDETVSAENLGVATEETETVIEDVAGEQATPNTNEPSVQEDFSATIATLKDEVSAKTNALIKANETIQSLRAELDTLRPFKEAAEKAERDRIESENAEKRKALSEYAKKSGFISVSEINDDCDIKTMISEMNESGIKNVIATRFMDSLNAAPDKPNIDVASTNNKTEEIATILDSDDDVGTTSIVKIYLKK